MSKDLPYFRFTCQEWTEGDISLENDSAKGVFVDVCCYYWIKNCSVLYQKLIKKFKKKSKKIHLLIKSGIIKRDGDYVRIDFLDEQLAELAETSKKLSEAGRKGVEARERNRQARLKPPLSNKDKDKDKDKDKRGPTPPKSNLEKRRELFKNEVREYNYLYSPDMLNRFYLYWTEPNKSKTKMRFELQKTWDLKRRLKTWADRDSNFQRPKQEKNKRTTGTEVEDTKKMLADQQKRFEEDPVTPEEVKGILKSAGKGIKDIV